VEHLVADYGLFLLFVLIAMESAGIPLPGETALVAGGVLERASAAVSGGETLAGTAACPCCGGPPEFALVERATGQPPARRLICARCDAAWAVERAGCVGCGETEPPTLARVPSPALGYDLAICNACGRYLKERTADAPVDLVVERVLTAELDAAAEHRGLRL
jgi:FdhE protein